jgi:hypothetical protein
MADINSPVGMLVQGSFKPQHRKDTKTKQPLWLDAAMTVPDMGVFFAVAFPKTIDGQPNQEFAAFLGELATIAATAWPQFFPQGPAYPGANPKFSWKIQDGDGFDSNGLSVSGKPGFKGCWVVKFDTSYHVKVFHDGKFAPSEEIQDTDTIKRGHYVSVFSEVKTNNGDLTKQQVPGIVIYPKLVTYFGGRKEDEITSGPDAMEVLGGRTVGWKPAGLSTLPGAPVGTLPASPSIKLPVSTPAPAPAAAPTYVVTAAAGGHTLDVLLASGNTIEALLAAGYIAAAPAPAPAPVALAIKLPTAVVLPKPTISLGAPPAQYQLKPELLAQGASYDALKADGWTWDTLVAQGHAVKIG